MADIINLNKARKRRAHEAAAARAEVNRAKFGRTKAEKALAAAQEQEAQHKLEQLRRDPATALDTTSIPPPDSEEHA